MFVCPECGERYPQAAFCSRDGTQALSGENDLLLGETISGYRIARLIGVGGMGRVYKGVDPSIGSRVAIKVLSRDCAENQELVERFFAEAKAVNVIRHENIVNVLSLDRLPDRRPFIVMEYLDGKPLSAVMDVRGPLPLGSFARITGEALSALGAAHAAGIIHRDLKPDNIFITPHGRAKVLDFGIAKLTGEQLGISAQTRDGSLMGTPHYMAPEQAQAKPVDPRTDIYSMGVILFEGVTGESLFDADGLYELLRMHVEKPPRPPRSLRHDLPPEYEAVILRALAKDPNHRQQSAKELYRELVEATRSLGESQWEPIGDQESRMSLGMSAIPTPAGPPTPSAQNLRPIGGHTPHFPEQVPQQVPQQGQPQRVGPAPSDAPPHSYQPTPQGSGQVFHSPQARPPSTNRTPLLIGIGLCAAAAIAAGVFFGTRDSDSETNTPTNTAGDQPVAEAGPDGGTAVGAGGVTVGSGGVTTVGSGGITVAGQQVGNQQTGLKPTFQMPPHPNTIGTADWPMDDNFKGYRPPQGSNAIDVTGFLPKAKELATKAFPDAKLARLDAYGVRPNGNADITLGANYLVIYHYISESAKVRPANLPIGVENEAPCRYTVMFTLNMTLYKTDTGSCEWPSLGPPKCSLKQVWRKAAKLGAPTGNVVAQLGYWYNDRKKKPMWLFTIGDKITEWIPDNC